ncbi:hypothetical protein AX766_07200 [Flavobacterium covae]|nr:hypothetical protein AWN65_12765 [Flavobacterium covae]AMA50278.1 hypothetical protein AWN65_12815 [Flavobacterium covae]AMA50288.1 hypothetical protein AWN65_12865 [Flavobacterium covae]AND64204.1 hypothetical protein AX766_07150 [Flavobacterium covae]AND64214.1 hypothetical protein AX766_07200 [Flavobacterium covae]
MSKQPKGVSMRCYNKHPQAPQGTKKALFIKWFKKLFLWTRSDVAVLRQCIEACDTQCGRGGTTRSNVAQCAESIALKRNVSEANLIGSSFATPCRAY